MKEEKFPHTRKPLHWRRWGGWQGESFRATEESAATGVQRAKRRNPTQRIGADQHSPAREACLLARRVRWGLGAEAPASEVRSLGSTQPEGGECTTASQEGVREKVWNC